MKYPEGTYEFVKSIVKGRHPNEVAELVNERFGSGTMTESQAISYMKRNKLKSGIDTRFKKGITPWAKGKTWDEIFSKEAQENVRRTQFKNGNEPHNKHGIGEIVVDSEGYWEIKVADTGNHRTDWKFLHRMIWENEHGKIMEGQYVVFKDGDKNNLSIDNLALVTKHEHLHMNRKKRRSDIAEVTEANINLTRYELAIDKLRKANKE